VAQEGPELEALSFKRADFKEAAPAWEYSPQQQSCIDWVLNGKGNAIIEAVAGSGKTSTLLGMLEHMQGYVSVIMFNKPVQVEVEQKVRDRGYDKRVQVGTFHSFGLRAWRRVAPQVLLDGLGKDRAGYHKYDRIWDVMNGIERLPGIEPTVIPFEYQTFVKKLTSMAKLHAIGAAPAHPIDDTDQWYELVDHYDLDQAFADDLSAEPLGIKIDNGIRLAKQALRISIRLAREVIDFDDMVYMPLFTECRMFQVDWILVDEAQDLNRSRRYLARKMLNPYRGRLVAVGDSRQAIYGFSGADAASFARIRTEFNCKDFPLTVTFRCPSKVVDLAKTWVDHIESKPGAAEGEVYRWSLPEFVKAEINPTDAVLCRNNAPLVSLAYALIRRGIACYIAGRDIGDGLIDLASKWRVARLSALVTKLQAYQEKEVAKLMAKKHEAQAETLADKVETLLAIIEGMPKESTLADLQQRVKTMFQDESGQRRQVTVLSSVHKAKGKEWKRVFLLGRNVYMPSKYARQDWHLEQEHNLMYVSVTRALETFVDIDVPSRKLDKDAFTPPTPKEAK